MDVDLKFFQVCQFVVDFLLLRCQLFLLLLKVFDDLIVGGVDIAGVTQEAGFLTRLGIFQEQGNGVRLAVFYSCLKRNGKFVRAYSIPEFSGSSNPH